MNTSKNSILEIVNVNKHYGDLHILKNINLKVREGEFFSILGQSGSGKSTLLNIIAGFESCDSGQIFIKGKLVNNLKPQERSVNTIFQNYALFPDMNIWDNVAFGLRIKKVSEEEINSQVSSILEMLDMGSHYKKFPDQLSGGQKQRVAIARALINKPEILLLDEPLSALDASLKHKTLYDLQKIQANFGVTFIFVTHDQSDAMEVSDTISVLKEGSIIQTDLPEGLYKCPKNFFIANFIGENNIIKVKIDSVCDKNSSFAYSRCMDKDNNVTFYSRHNIENFEDSDLNLKDQFVFIRPEHVKVQKIFSIDNESNLRNEIIGTVITEGYRGSYIKLGIQTDLGTMYSVRFSGFSNDEDFPEMGDLVKLSWKEQDMKLVVN